MRWWRPRKTWALAALLPLLFGVFVATQNIFNQDRSQIVKDKYRLFEQALVSNSPDDETLAQATAALDRRGGIFFHGKFPETIDAIGEAWAILEGNEWDLSRKSFWSWQLDPPRRLLPARGGDLSGERIRQARLRQVFLSREGETIPLEFHFRIRKPGGSIHSEGPVEVRPDRPKVGGIPIPIPPDLPEGTYTLELDITQDGAPLGLLSHRFSVVEDLAPRLITLTESAKEARQKASPERRSAAASLDYALTVIMHEALVKRTDYEGDLLGLLRRSEEAAETILAGGDPYRQMRGDLLRAFVLDGGAEVRCRLYVPPESAPAEKIPLLLALHGWKDDEHKFFEFNGGGTVRRLAEERGFLLVSPRRSSMSAEGEKLIGLVEHLLAAYPMIDEDRIFVIAHSWGARQAMDAALQKPGIFDAIALFAGSSKGGSLGEISGIPLFLTCGGEDARSLRGCRKMAAQAEDIGHRPFIYREAKGVGHVEILWRVAEEAFRWMEEKAAER